MNINIIKNKFRYTNTIEKKYIPFINAIAIKCKEITNKNINIDFWHTDPYLIQKVARKNYIKIINNIETEGKYQKPEDIVFPTTISFLYDDNYAEIYLSVYNILRKYKTGIKAADQQIKLYIAHSICNVYQVSDEDYNDISNNIK